MKKTMVVLLFLLLGSVHFCAAAELQKKILYIDSYSPAYPWSAGVTAGIESVLEGRDDIQLRIFRMDTKRNPSEEAKKNAALEAKRIIDEWKPDIVIASDDNASKYLIVPYYKDADVPFVFCGVNWYPAPYGYPFTNVTGMVEISLMKEMIALLRGYAHGDRVGYIAPDTTTSRVNTSFYRSVLGLELDGLQFVKTLKEWKRAYLQQQEQADIVIMTAWAGIPDWNEQEVLRFVQENTKVPTGSVLEHMAPYTLVSFAKIAREQGEWAAGTALEILAGKSPADIPIVTNKQAKIILNMKLARKLDIKFPMELIQRSHLISAEKQKLLYINSYHKGYRWSDDIEKGVLKALDITVREDGSLDTSKSPVELKIMRMDTKINKSEEFKKQAALQAKTLIDEWQPDIVVMSDDNAAKYLLMPYYKNAALPFVFCGVNWDASVYGLPFSNSTGMVEVAPVDKTVAELRKYGAGDRLGYIGVNTISEEKNRKGCEKVLQRQFDDGKLVDDFTSWKEEYLRLQDSVDMLICFSPVGIRGWNEEEARAFILKHTRIPTGATVDSNIGRTLLGHVKLAEEQGWWAGSTALKVLAGTSPADIPVLTNTQAKLYLNMQLAKRLGIKFPMELIQKATFVEE